MATRQSQSQAQAQAHLPPRCPSQKRPSHGSFSCSSKPAIENHPPWLDDLLTEPDAGPAGGLRPLRRSVSDPVTLLDGVMDSFSIGDNLTSGGLESSSSMYGPNSPRLRRASSLFSDSAIASALSECVSQESGHYVDGMVDGGELNTDPRIAKRHPGQRSRIRKLQYIAELERTVDVLQTLESDLAVRVASLLQQRVSLAVENNKLKQQLAGMRREKLIVDGQYQILKKEAKGLRMGLSNSTNGKIRMCFGPNSQAEAMQMGFDMENLNLY